MKDEDCRGELLARERRGQLSPSHRMALEAHLSRCQSCRLAQAIFTDFAAEGAADPSDGLRIQRLSVGARRWATRPARAGGRGWRRVMAFAASLVLVGGSASAAVWWWRKPAAPMGQPGEDATPVGAGHPGRLVGVSAMNRAVPPSPPAVAVVPPSVPAVAAVSPAPAPSLSPSPPPSLSASRTQVARRPERAAAVTVSPPQPSTLLRHASDARRAGQTDRAIALYRQLEREFPRSPEAELAAVPLGVLLLDQGLPRDALAEFNRYLASSRAGTLTPEAHYGRGRALARLGDRAEERRTWQRLLADFPDSTYSPHGRRRLAELR